MDSRILVEWAERLEWHDSIESTNDRARELAAEGVGHGFLVGAEEQTAGRGRKGARWQSEPGRALTFSVVVRPGWGMERWGWLSLAAGLAVSETLEDFGFAPTVKWPNDVLLEDRKVCGILIERAGEAAVIGIGINVNEDGFPEGLNATSLALSGGRQLVRDEVLAGVWRRLLDVLQREIPEISEAVWERLAWRDREVETSSGEQGRIRGFGENGELRIETADRLISISDASGVRPRGGAF